MKGTIWKNDLKTTSLPLFQEPIFSFKPILNFLKKMFEIRGNFFYLLSFLNSFHKKYTSYSKENIDSLNKGNAVVSNSFFQIVHFIFINWQLIVYSFLIFL